VQHSGKNFIFLKKTLPRVLNSGKKLFFLKKSKILFPEHSGKNSSVLIKTSSPSAIAQTLGEDTKKQKKKKLQLVFFLHTEYTLYT
jgi:hypothetical protein